MDTSFYHEHSFSVYLTGGIIIIVLLIGLIYFGRRSCKIPTIEVIARSNPSNEMQSL